MSKFLELLQQAELALSMYDIKLDDFSAVHCSDGNIVCYRKYSSDIVSKLAAYDRTICSNGMLSIKWSNIHIVLW